ncbi:MAG: PorT family protein [Bacteroidetes bacterium]|nr:PorT family protein [Bacteroidota bacterium]
MFDFKIRNTMKKQIFTIFFTIFVVSFAIAQDQDINRESDNDLKDKLKFGAAIGIYGIQAKDFDPQKTEIKDTKTIYENLASGFKFSIFSEYKFLSFLGCVLDISYSNTTSDKKKYLPKSTFITDLLLQIHPFSGNFYFASGPSIGYVISFNDKNDDNKSTIDDTNKDNTKIEFKESDYNKFQYGVGIKIGYNFDLGIKFELNGSVFLNGFEKKSESKKILSTGGLLLGYNLAKLIL